MWAVTAIADMTSGRKIVRIIDPGAGPEPSAAVGTTVLRMVPSTAKRTRTRSRPTDSQITGKTSSRLRTLKLGPPASLVNPMARQSNGNHGEGSGRQPSPRDGEAKAEDCRVSQQRHLETAISQSAGAEHRSGGNDQNDGHRHWELAQHDAAADSQPAKNASATLWMLSIISCPPGSEMLAQA